MTVFGFTRDTTTLVEAHGVLYQGQLPNTATTLYTTPSGKEAFIQTICLTNQSLTGAARTVDLKVNGTAASNRFDAVFALESQWTATYGDGHWSVLDTGGRLLKEAPQQLLASALQCPPYLAETLDRRRLEEVNVAALTSGQLFLQAIWLTQGMVINWITFSSATTAAGTPTNQLFGLFDGSRNQVAVTSNDTTTAWGANTVKTLKISSTYTVPTTGLYYVGVMVTATTVPTLKGPAALIASNLHGVAPILNGNSSSGLTTSLPNPAAAITVSTTQVWGAVS
jgi:hypothetical protein